MARYRVELLAPALSDLEAVAEYYARGDIQKTKARMLSYLERLSVFPLYCPPVPCGDLAERGFKMLVDGSVVYIYRLDGDTVSIYHIIAAGPLGSVYPALFPGAEE